MGHHRATLSACRQQQQRGGSVTTTTSTLLTYQSLVGSLFLFHILYSTMQYTTTEAMEAQDFDGIVDDEVLIPWKKARPRGPPRFGKRSLPPAALPYASDEASEMRQMLIRGTPLHPNADKNVFMLKRGLSADAARHEEEDGNAEAAPAMLFLRRWLQDASAVGGGALASPMPLAFVERHSRSATVDASSDNAAAAPPSARSQRAIRYPRPSASRLLMLPKSF